MMTNEQRCQLRINGVYKQIRDTHQAIRKGGHLPRNITSTTKQAQLDRAFQIIQLIVEGRDMDAVGWDVCPFCHGFGDASEDTPDIPCPHCNEELSL